MCLRNLYQRKTATLTRMNANDNDNDNDNNINKKITRKQHLTLTQNPDQFQMIPVLSLSTNPGRITTKTTTKKTKNKKKKLKTTELKTQIKSQ